MVDDVLTEDRISIISKGSVASFKELSSYVDESCRYHVTMSVTIGMNKMAEMLSESVVEKSGAVEVDLSSLSNVYKFNQKQMELNKENERRIVDALMEDVSRILRIGGDFSDIYSEIHCYGSSRCKFQDENGGHDDCQHFPRIDKDKSGCDSQSR